MNTSKLKGYFAENNLTLEQVAIKCGLNYNTIQRLLATGKCNLDTARAIIKGLEMPLQLANDIFFDDIVAN